MLHFSIFKTFCKFNHPVYEFYKSKERIKKSLTDFYIEIRMCFKVWYNKNVVCKCNINAKLAKIVKEIPIAINVSVIMKDFYISLYSYLC